MARWVHLLVLAVVLGSLVSLGVSRAQETERPLIPQTQTLSGSVFWSATPADALEPGTLTTVFETDATVAPAPFTYLMLRWRASAAPETLLLEVRVSEDGEQWSAWGNVAENADLHDPADPPDQHWSDIIYSGVARSWQLRATYQGVSSTPLIDEVQVDTIDARGGDNAAQDDDRLTAAQTGQSLGQPGFVSRASWGGSSVLNNSTAPTWSTATHMVLHHTADANTLVKGETSWAERVRAIWAFHRYTRNWGDIGYNWLIDPNGVIYEGRNGSANLERDAVGIHDTANTGSMGVALIGTFGAGGRYSPIVPTNAAQDTLVGLMAWKANQRNIDPEGSSQYAGCVRSSLCRVSHPGAIVENISGHRDVVPGETSCPGDLAAGLLPALRSRVRDALSTSRLDATPTVQDGGSQDTSPSVTPDVPTQTPTRTSTPTATPSPTATLPPTATATPRPFTRIEGNVHWTTATSPIILDQDQRIVAGAVLQIDAGVEVRLASGVDLHVDGQLSASGTAESPVRFVGLDGRWGVLIGHEGSTIVLEHTELHGAGANGTALGGVGGQMSLRNVLVTDGGGGISVDGTALEIRDSAISGNQLDGGPALQVVLRAQVPLVVSNSIFGTNLMPRGTPQVRLSGGEQGTLPFELQGNVFSGDVGPLLELRTSSPLSGIVRCNSFTSGSIGIQLSSSTPSAAGFGLDIDTNAFVGQSQYGVASTIALDAGNNWWGDASGPADVARNPNGRGPRVGIHVDFAPVLPSRPDCAPAQ